MRLQDLTRISLLNLQRRKLRTFFTLLGVIIGTSSIILMMSLGIASSESINKMIESSGGATEIMVNSVAVKDDTQSRGNKGMRDKNVPTMTDKAIVQFKDLPYVEAVSPILTVNVGMKQGAYKSDYMNITGVSKEYLEAKNFKIKEGNLPTGKSNQLELFFGNTVLAFFSKGNKSYWETGVVPEVKIVGGNFNLSWEIIPMENSSPSESGGDMPERQFKKTKGIGVGVMEGGIDDYNEGAWQVYADLDALKTQLKKIYGNGAIPGQPETKKKKANREWVYSQIAVYVDDVKHVEETQKILTEMGYDTSSNLELRKSFESGQRMMQLLLGGIGSISLFVATIGIVNTMMMSTYERQKEIGVYKVLGCKLRDILWLFLFEASFIGFIGGVIGLILSVMISFLLNSLAGGLGEVMGGPGAKVSIITLSLALMGVGFATAMGTLAGYFPARRATNLSALAAIKTE